MKEMPLRVDVFFVVAAAASSILVIGTLKAVAAQNHTKRWAQYTLAFV
jgi:hypothetical protein